MWIWIFSEERGSAGEIQPNVDLINSQRVKGMRLEWFEVSGESPGGDQYTECVGKDRGSYLECWVMMKRKVESLTSEGLSAEGNQLMLDILGHPEGLPKNPEQ